MSFGNPFKTAYAAAKQAARETFDEMAGVTRAAANKVADTAKAAADKAVQGANYVADKAAQGAKYVADKTVQGASYVADKAVQGAKYVAGKTVQGANYIADKTVQGAKFAKAKAVETAKQVRQKIIDAKNSVADYLGPQPAGAPIQSCPFLKKKERLQQRAQKVSAAKDKANSLPPGREKEALEKSIVRFEFNNVAVERVKLASSTYNIGQGKEPEGWARLSKEEIEDLGLNPNQFPASQPGFDPDTLKDGDYFAEIYKSDPDVFGKETIVIAFRGTAGMADWTNANIPQSVGRNAPHYTKAMSLANDLKSAKESNPKLANSNVEITGHSLGGGMATAAGIVSGLKTYAVNPAGVHPITLKPYGRTREDADDLVHNIVTEDEVLTSYQEPGFQRATLAAISLVSPRLGASLMLTARKALIDKGTLTYGMAGKRHDVRHLGNAKDVSKASDAGESIQGQTPSKFQSLNAMFNPKKKVELHHPDYAIAGIEQQKADDLNLMTSGFVC